jgi:serine/threonine-protein kinase
MKIDTQNELHPILVADLSEERYLVRLHTIAERRGAIFVPLLAGPVDRRTHILECYLPGAAGPVMFLAEPVGPPTDRGFPLKLAPYEAARLQAVDASGSELESETSPASLAHPVAKRGTSPGLSARHSRDLEHPDAPPPAPEADVYIGRLLANGKYGLEVRVGSGGMGAVYRGRHRDLDKEVAIKVLHTTFQADAEFSKRFHAEALTMSKIDHPNVTRILDFGQEADGLLYLAMEFLDGVDLQSVLDEEGALPLERAVRIISGVCAGLGHVHRHGIIHRDIKPSNILLISGLDDDDTPTEVPKVCDFGVALAWTGNTQSSHVAGTPEYMSPEQCQGMVLDARSDVYACGMLMYELATGKLPFTGDDAALTARRQVTEEPPPPSAFMPDIDPLFESVILKAIAKDPAARQQSMRQLRAELRELLAPVAVSMDTATDSRASLMVPGSSPDLLGATPPSAPAPRESWLELQSEGMTSFLFEHQGQVDEVADLGASLARDPEMWLAHLEATHDPEKFAAEAALLEPVMRKLMKAADAPTISLIIRALRSIIKAEGAVGPRATAAGSILRMLRDPPRLAPLVAKALATEDTPPALLHCLVEPQTAGAQALLDGRLLHASPTARASFIKIMRAIGPASLAPLTVALRGCLDRGEQDGPHVEDLLQAIPPGPSDATGSVVAEFLRSSSAATSSTALYALSGLWGERARPLLFGALGNVSPVIVMAAIAGLRALRSIDTHVVARLDAIFTANVAAMEDARVAAAVALGEALPEARSAAQAVAARAFTPPRQTLWSSPPPSGSPVLAVALGRTLLALGAPNAAALIQQRAATSPEVVRRHLLALVTGAY